jgi:IS5 family transposase
LLASNSDRGTVGDRLRCQQIAYSVCRREQSRVAACEPHDLYPSGSPAVNSSGSDTAVERAKNRTKSKVRARVEHAIGVIKRVFGFAKVRYRGLNKNLHRLLVTCALANLFMARRHLLRCQPA